MNIVATPTAKKSYFKIIEYLIEHWNGEIANNFIEETQQTIEVLETNPCCFSVDSVYEDYRKGHLNPNISFFYKIYENEIVIHLFWNNVRNPKRLKKMLR